MGFLKNQFKKAVFNISANYAPLVKAFYRATYKPKRGTVSEILDCFSRVNRSVTFIQVGANDGFYHDPLHKFIRMYGWKGVMLEPQPSVYKNYLSKLHRKTPGVHAINAALSDRDGEQTMYKIAFSDLRWATGLTSFKKDALEKAIDSGHVGRLAARYGEPLPARREDYIAEEKITSISADTLIRKYNLTKIDWVQIDAEGFDYEIIKLLKIDKTQPQVIVYEKSHLSAADQSACIQWLESNGYAVTHIDENTVAMRKPLGEFEQFFK
ncbi:MAG TPA: FkbM family methyltransferase [Chryseosolibacter sp.]